MTGEQNGKHPKCPNMFTPTRLGPVELRNRIVNATRPFRSASSFSEGGDPVSTGPSQIAA
jgi:2,4-dienoyl-CoA reductase-like NADH-dependent reductase (Old Yellow Enzyme family)